MSSRVTPGTIPAARADAGLTRRTGRTNRTDKLPPAMSLVSGKVLVTGASGGIGQAIVQAFAARGAELIVSGRRTDVLEPLATRVGGRAIRCDLANRDDVARLASEAADVDVFVANAALPASGVVTELTPEQIDQMLEINLRAPVALARALAPGMIERRRGHMVFISSLSGKVASPASSIYSATKFGLRGFALGLREDLRPFGVGASVVLPGFIRDAGMFADSHVRLPSYVGTRSPDDVAAAVIRAIERDRAEVEVAPVGLRIAANFGGVAPELAGTVSRRMGGDKIAARLAEGQIDKRP
jgi:short-subunit dehydrogenase